jgi:hypothetical protein
MGKIRLQWALLSPPPIPRPSTSVGYGYDLHSSGRGPVDQPKREPPQTKPPMLRIEPWSYGLQFGQSGTRCLDLGKELVPQTWYAALVVVGRGP